MSYEKSLAIMQPYFFPYIGYFQLINAVDEFVFYDDVNFIKQGWINRNKILINDTEIFFTVPLRKASSFSLIKDTEIHPILFGKWKKKFLKSIEQAYKKAPYYEAVFPIVEDILYEEISTMSELAIKSVEETTRYLDMKTTFLISSEQFSETKNLGRTPRLKEICRRQKAEKYVNLIGGKELYDVIDFASDNIQLSFLKPKIKEYPQKSNGFVGGLSILDVLMNNSSQEVKRLLQIN